LKGKSKANTFLRKVALAINNMGILRTFAITKFDRWTVNTSWSSRTQFSHFRFL